MNKFESGVSKENPESYAIFDDGYERHDIYEFCKELALYVKEEGIKDIVFIDRSARPAWIGVDEYWNINHGDFPKPGFYFVNPEAFNPMADMYDTETDEDTSGLVVVTKGRIVSVKRLREGEGQIIERFKELFPRLFADRDKPILVFDTCAHTGRHMKNTVNILKQAGFKDVRIITANPPDRTSEVVVAKNISHNAQLTSCYPFGSDSGVNKGDDLVSSLNTSRTEEVSLVRQEIRRIIQDQGK